MGATDSGNKGGRWPVDRLQPIVEALVFASGEPLAAREIAELVAGCTAAEATATLEVLAKGLEGRGVRLVEVAGGWQLRTAPEHHQVVRQLFKERPYRLTRAATETLTIIAYRQPVTKAEIEAVRGVDSSGVLENLVEKRLARIAGRRDGPGRPLLYATTPEFLELFGLKDLRALPTLAELGDDFERMAEQSEVAQAGGTEQGILPVDAEDGEEGAGGQTEQASKEEGTQPPQDTQDPTVERQ